MSDKKNTYSPKITVTAGGKLKSLPEQKEPEKKLKSTDELSYSDMVLYFLETSPSVKVINNMSRFDNDCFGFIEDPEEYELFEYEIEEINSIRLSYNIPEAPILHMHFYDLPIEQVYAENILKGNLEVADSIYDLTEKTDMDTIDGNLHMHAIFLPEAGDGLYNHYRIYCSVIVDAKNDYMKNLFNPVSNILKKNNKIDRIYDMKVHELVYSEDGNKYMILFSYNYIDSALIELV